MAMIGPVEIVIFPDLDDPWRDEKDDSDNDDSDDEYDDNETGSSEEDW